MRPDGLSALEFLHSTLNWLDQFEQTADPSRDSESVAN
jgi:hypothetical protein